jgi:hypothetical protein
MKFRNKTIALAAFLLLSLTLAACKPLTAEELMAKSYEKMDALKTVNSSMEVLMEYAGQSMTVTGDLQNELPDKSYAVLQASGQTIEILSLSTTELYIKDDTGAWQPIPAEQIKQLGLTINSNDQMKQVREAMTGLTLASEDTINGTTCQKITYTLDAEKAFTSIMDASVLDYIDMDTVVSKGEACVADKTYYMLKTVMDLTFTTQGEEIHEAVTIVNSKFDEPVEIPTP